MGFESESRDHQLLSKIATNDKHGENSPYFDGWKAYDRDPFHPTKNPHGVIQMGLAENQVTPTFFSASSSYNECGDGKVFDKMTHRSVFFQFYFIFAAVS